MNQTNDAIYLVTGDNQLQRVQREHYQNEDLLQKLIATFPEILAGDQMESEEAVRFMLVKREAGIPDSEDSGDRWSVDHLLLDQYGVPTLVEVKRSSDTRIRREMVGQLLEYAANANQYWPVGRIRELALKNFGNDDDLNLAILELQGVAQDSDNDENIESFWTKVDENLRNGKLRLLFVADELPREVRRIIEFLNAKMNDVQVLGVELRQYVGDSLKAIVPRVIGQTEATRAKTAALSSPRFATQEEMVSQCTPEVRQYVNDVLAGAKSRALAIGPGVKGFSMRVAGSDGKLQSIFFWFPPGTRGAATAYMRAKVPPALQNTVIGEEIARKLRSIPSLKEIRPYIFHLDITNESVAAARQAVAIVWEFASKIKEVGSAVA